MVLYNSVHDREAEAGTLADSLGRKERFKDMLTIVHGYASARIPDLDHHMPTCAGLPAAADHTGIKRNIFCGYSECSAARHGISRVDRQIEEHLMDLGGLAGNGPKTIRDPRHNLYIAGKGFGKEEPR